MSELLVDAGPLVALLNARDNEHARCVAVLKTLRSPMITTWMAVTEAMYLLGFSTRAQTSLLEMIERKAVLAHAPDASDLPAIRTVMRRYSDLPMDFADASLVALANRRRVDRIFTLDQRDFSLYRLARGKRFSIVPEPT